MCFPDLLPADRYADPLAVLERKRAEEAGVTLTARERDMLGNRAVREPLHRSAPIPR